MHSLQILEPDDPFKVVHRLFVRLLRTQVVPRCKRMTYHANISRPSETIKGARTRVDTDSDPIFIRDLFDNLRQLFKRRSQDIARASLTTRQTGLYSACDEDVPYSRSHRRRSSFPHARG